RPRIPCIRFRKPGDIVELLGPRLRRRREAARAAAWVDAGRRALSARLNARRLHRASCDDLHAPARFRLERYRRRDPRPVVASRGDAALFPEDRQLPVPLFLALNPLALGWADES